METIDLIPRLLSAALGNKGPVSLSDLGEEEWKFLLGVFAAQNVHTLVYDAIDADSMPLAVREVWQSQVEAVEAFNRRTESVVAAQEIAWKKNGLGYALMKGPSMASLYPVPLHRGSGDIDWCFTDEKSWDKALKMAARNAEAGIRTDSDGDVNYSFNGVVIEHHRNWNHLSSRRLRSIAGPPRVVDGRLCPEDALLSAECHILHHLAYKGLCLKQFADLAVAFKAFDGKYDKAAFAARLDSLGLLRWSRLLHSTLAVVAGIGPDFLPTGALSSDKDVERLVSVVLCDGVSPHNRRLNLRILLRRVALMLKYGGGESVARYFYLLKGRFISVK